MAIVFAVFSGLIMSCSGHGRLQVPTTRRNVINNGDIYENDPVSGSTGADFACRNDPQSVPAENKWTAGDQIDVKWLLSAKHVGDCALWISYDHVKTGSAKADMKFFKIANWFDCKSMDQDTLKVTLPSWLPAGRAVIRWDWYALHVFPTIEYYSQCADVNINASVNSLQVSDVPAYSVVNLFPTSGKDAAGMRNPFGAGVDANMAGPPCACQNAKDNGCPLTADTGGKYYIAASAMASCGGDEVDSTPRPTIARIIDATSTPTVAGNDSCPSKCSSCITYSGTCNQWCSKYNYCGNTEAHKFIDCTGCGSDVVSPTPAPVVSPTPAPVVSPTPAPVVSDCDETGIDGMLKGKKDGKFKGVETPCACLEKCKGSKGYTFSAKKKMCVCLKSLKTKKGELVIKDKADFVYMSSVQ